MLLVVDIVTDSRTSVSRRGQGNKFRRFSSSKQEIYKCVSYREKVVSVRAHDPREGSICLNDRGMKVIDTIS